MKTLIFESISEEKLFEVLVKCFNLPGLDDKERKKWRQGFAEVFFTECYANKENKISMKVYNYFCKHNICYGDKSMYEQNIKSYIRRRDIINIFISLSTYFKNRANLFRVLFDYIFTEKGLYKDILLNHTSLAEVIYNKLNEFIEAENGKYKNHFKCYITEHNHQRQKILLF